MCVLDPGCCKHLLHPFKYFYGCTFQRSILCTFVLVYFSAKYFLFLFVDGPSGSTLVPRWRLQAWDVKIVTPDRRILVSTWRRFLHEMRVFSYASGGIFFHVSLVRNSLSHECRILSAESQAWDQPANRIACCAPWHVFPFQYFISFR